LDLHERFTKTTELQTSALAALWKMVKIFNLNTVFYLGFVFRVGESKFRVGAVHPAHLTVSYLGFVLGWASQNFGWASPTQPTQ
jgi:hypothetical protein